MSKEEYMYRDNILIVDDTLSDDLCDAMIDYFEKSRKHGLGWEGTSALRKDEQLALHRLDTINLHEPVFTETYMNMFWQRLYPEYLKLNPHLEQVPPHGVHWLKLQKTPIGGGFHDFHHETQQFQSIRRILVVMAYLNNVDEGGETEFLNHSLRVPAKRGRSLIFPAYFTHPHRGNPPISNEKYIITGWLEV